MTWEYWRSEPGLWTVGQRDEAGEAIITDSDHGSRDAAAARAARSTSGRGTATAACNGSGCRRRASTTKLRG